MGKITSAAFQLNDSGTPTHMLSGDGQQVNVVTATTDAVGGGSRVLIAGDMVSGEWVTTPTVFRLLLNGTGTVTLDARDAAGTVTTSVETYTLSSAVNQIEFPYGGDSAVAILATLTGTATAKVI